jgi:predicted alpha/beta hydrolase family esterase
VRTAGAYARAWGSEFVRLQKAGHINIESGFGAWPLGLALLQSLTGENHAVSVPPPTRSTDLLESA